MARQLKRTHAVLVGDVLKDGRRLGHFDVSIDEIGELLEKGELKRSIVTYIGEIESKGELL